MNVKSPTCAQTAVHAKTVMAVLNVIVLVDFSTTVPQVLVQVRTMPGMAPMQVTPPFF